MFIGVVVDLVRSNICALSTAGALTSQLYCSAAEKRALMASFRRRVCGVRFFADIAGRIGADLHSL